MQPTALDIQRSGDLGGHKVAMRFDENSIAHIMSVLTDLYSDPELAVIREYSTNAWDSHIAAGVSKPIEVTTPSSLTPYFRVKDYGLGLSVYDIEEIYSKYGASTKRDSNDQVGMLGLGCKSALTYTNQFTLVSVKDGVKATVSISRIEDGTGMMEIVDLSDCDEPNGVEVTVPVNKSNEFEFKAQKLYRFWEPGTVLLNGREPARIEGDYVGDRMMVVNNLDTDHVVMGGVAYPLNRNNRISSTGGYNQSFGVVAFVGIGDVNFTPSREALHYTSRTEKTLEDLRKEFSERLKETIEADIANASSHAEAIEKYVVWTNRFGNGTKGVEYQGEPVPVSWELPAGERYMVYRPNRSRDQVQRGYNSRIDYSTLNSSVTLYDFPGDGIAPYQRTKVKLWAESQGISLDRVIVTPSMPGLPWTANCKMVSWEDVRKIKLPSNKTRSASGLRFKMVGSDGLGVDTDELDANLDIVYFSPADYKWDSMSGVFRRLTDEVQCVMLNRNRWDKFDRDFPTAKMVTEWMLEKVKAAEAALTADDKLAMGIENYEKNRLIKLDETALDDPELVKFVQLAKMPASDSPTRLAYEQICRMARDACGMHISQPSVTTPLDRYPLADLGYGNVHPHVYIYVNAAYAAELAKENSDETVDEESAA